MAAFSKMRRANNMQMFGMLPKNGLYYEFWDEEDEGEDRKAHIRRRILPANMSTKIMIQLNKKYVNPTKKDFDHAIAELFNNASRDVFNRTKDGKNPSYDSEFWRDPKVGTIFEKLSDNTTYRFAVKLLEARDLCFEQRGARQTYSGEGEAVKAIDLFKENVEVAALASDGVDALKKGDLPDEIDFTMSSYLIDQFEEASDTDESDLSEDEAPTQPRPAKRAKLENADTADDGIETPAAKRVKVEKAGVTDSVARFDPALIFRTAQLSLGGSAPESSNGAEEVRRLGASVRAAFVARQTPELRALIEEEDRMLEEMLKQEMLKRGN